MSLRWYYYQADTIKEKLEGLSEIDFSIPGLLGGLDILKELKW